MRPNRKWRRRPFASLIAHPRTDRPLSLSTSAFLVTMAKAAQEALGMAKAMAGRGCRPPQASARSSQSESNAPVRLLGDVIADGDDDVLGTGMDSIEQGIERRRAAVDVVDGDGAGGHGARKLH